MTRDDEHLRLLSAFHYVVAAIAGAFALLPLFHFFVGVAMVSAALVSHERDALPGALIGSFFVAFAAFWMVAGSILATCLVLAGQFLAQRRHYTFCLVTAGLACAFGPFGTVLGIFTLLVLLRDGVRAQFDVGAPAPAA
jgi:hypothetical protein